MRARACALARPRRGAARAGGHGRARGGGAPEPPALAERKRPGFRRVRDAACPALPALAAAVARCGGGGEPLAPTQISPPPSKRKPCRRPRASPARWPSWTRRSSAPSATTCATAPSRCALPFAGRALLPFSPPASGFPPPRAHPFLSSSSPPPGAVPAQRVPGLLHAAHPLPPPLHPFTPSPPRRRASTICAWAASRGSPTAASRPAPRAAPSSPKRRV